ncbi:MAG: polysaccharide biosynthesis tyrosine autokinase [Firmicutes bacterium]|nr:polysaccharide biosynthesis tyrosine autokinase [Candidatus Colimorpha enterica]
MSEHSGQQQKIDLKIDNVLHAFLKRLKRLWFFVILITALFGVLGGLKTSLSYSPIYRAQASYTIELDEMTKYYEKQTANQLAVSFPYILSSTDFVARIREKLGTDRINGSLSSSVVSGTNLLTVSVTSSDPRDAYDILCAAVEIYPEATANVVGETNLNMVIAPVVPVNPINQLNVVRPIIKWALVGLALILAIILISSMLNPTVLHKDDIRYDLKINNVLAIPAVKIGKNQGESALCISNKSINKSFYNAVGQMRINVEHYAKKEGINSIMITSTRPSEGKTTVALNLALSMCRHGKKVIIIDCDLRNPSILSTLGVTSTTSSFSDVLRGSVQLSSAIINIANNLDVLADLNYNKDASELCSANSLKAIIHTAEQLYDIVIVDTPPVSVAADSVIISKYVGGYIYVIKQDYAVIGEIYDSLTKIGESDSVRLCAILNAAKRSGSGSGSYGYGYGYSYGS